MIDTPWPVCRYDTLDSTSLEAARRARGGDIVPAWIVAGAQTAGKGQRGRKWLSPPGNLAATALFPLQPGRDPAALGLVAGLAVADAVTALLRSERPVLKWPNDLRWRRRKLGGVLVETGVSSMVRWAAVGFGVNVGNAPAADQATVCLHAIPGGGEVGVEELFAGLDRSLRARLGQWIAGAWHVIGEDWIACAEPGRLQLRAGGESRRGVLVGIDGDGRLVLSSDEGGAFRVRIGNVRAA